MSPHLPPSLVQMLRPTSPECIDKSTTDRHFVTWTDQEDEILRQAVTTYGVDKWSVIAAQFTNKTSRQCRRRWHTYLVTDCKKGGWSPEEDQLLLEAHSRFGNRWTEIAKMVPGRTDNAVKNRFSALGKKQAKKSSACNINGADTKIVLKRKVLQQSSSITNKRNRGDYSPYLSCNYNLQQQKQNHFQVKQSLQTWNADQSMADRAHPVNIEKIRKDALYSTANRTMQDLKNKKLLKCSGVVPANKSASNEGHGISISQMPHSFSENVSPLRLASLAQNAALLDSLVERRDARLKLWGSIDDTWKSFDWFTIEDNGKILQPANFTTKNVPLGDMRAFLYEGKENCLGYSQISCESRIPGANTVSQESVNQHKHLNDLGTATPTIQHERAWKVRSDLEGLDCSSPSDEINYQADVSTPLQTDCYSSFPVDQTLHTDVNEVEPRVACDTQCQGLRAGHREESQGAVAIVDAVDDYAPSATAFSWDSHFFFDDMPSPKFSDSEKQFLLSALDSSHQASVIESHLLGSNMNMASSCI